MLPQLYSPARREPTLPPFHLLILPLPVYISDYKNVAGRWLKPALHACPVNHSSSWPSDCSVTVSLLVPSELLADESLEEELSAELESEVSVFCALLLSVSFFTGFWTLGLGLGILLILPTCKCTLNKKWHCFLRPVKSHAITESCELDK